jgi:hypothetical protein
MSTKHLDDVAGKVTMAVHVIGDVGDVGDVLRAVSARRRSACRAHQDPRA